MPFEVPEGHEGLSRQVFQKFRSLVISNVIDVITATQFDAWRRNFQSHEEEYMAAQMLSAAVIRTTRMNQSGYRQIAEVIVPELLRDVGIWTFEYVDELEAALQQRRPSTSLSFMPVDGQLLDARPGNSADSIVRAFGQTARIGDGYLVRADDASVWQNPPTLLVFMDDLLGTGRQFQTFVERYNVNDLPATTRCVYVPLLATRQGVDAVTAAFPRVSVRPVETLQACAAFFNGMATAPELWARDRRNTVAEARQFYQGMMQAKGTGPESRHSLELTVLLPGRAPNNTLKAYWTNHGQWTPLLPR